MVHKHPNHMCLYTQRLQRQIVQDDAPYKPPLLIFEHPTLKLSPRTRQRLV